MIHTCINANCGAQYEDEEVDAYYCRPCKAAHKQLADQKDAERAMNPRTDEGHMTAVEQYDTLRGRKLFPTAQELGIW